MINGAIALMIWLANLFNPPPLDSMNQGQRMVRIFLVALTLFVFCIGTAMLGAFGLMLTHEFLREPTALPGAEIVLVGVLGNALCWRTLLVIRRR